MLLSPASVQRMGWRGSRVLAATLVLSLLGIAVATYLTIVHYRQDLLVCSLNHGCETVQKSSYAVVAGIPIAILGLAMYVALLGLTVLRARRPDRQDWGTMAAFAIAFAGVLYAGYLTYVELFVLHAICQWCVGSAIITLAICAVEGVGVWRLLDVDPADE
jgi:uncharacterized membrane protein